METAHEWINLLFKGGITVIVLAIALGVIVFIVINLKEFWEDKKMDRRMSKRWEERNGG